MFLNNTYSEEPIFINAKACLHKIIPNKNYYKMQFYVSQRQFHPLFQDSSPDYLHRL